MKKKVLSVILVLCIIVVTMIVSFSFLRFPLSRLHYSILGSYSATGRTEFCSFPNGERRGILAGHQNVLITKTIDGTYYGYEKNETTNFLYFLDASLQIKKVMETDIEAVKLTCFDNSVGLLSKEGEKYSFYTVDIFTGKTACYLDNLSIKSPDSFVSFGAMIMYATEDDSIILNKEGATIVFPGEGYYPLCIKDEDNILVLKPIVDYFKMGEIKEYQLSSGKLKHIRYAYCPSTTCCISRDGRFLLSFEIINSRSEYNAVLIDLKLPRHYTSRANALDYDYVEWKDWES